MLKHKILFILRSSCKGCCTFYRSHTRRCTSSLLGIISMRPYPHWLLSACLHSLDRITTNSLGIYRKPCLSYC